MAYNPADFELVEAPAGSAPPYNPADFELVAEPEGSGFWRQSLDIPVSALGGVVTGLKGMTDLFGANNPVSQELASYQQFYNQSLSPEGQADQQEVARIMQEAEDKGMWEQIKAGGRAFAVAPLDTAAQSLGTMAPIVATGLAGRAVGLGARGVQAVQAGAGAGMNTGIVKDSIYQDTKNFLLQSGKSEEEADRVALEAQSYGGQNIDQLLLAAGLGAADAVFGAEKILGNAISKSGGRVTGGVVASALKTGVSEAIPEAAQGGQEAMAPNIALQREGYNVPTMRGVFAQGTMEGLAGFAAGAPVGAAEGMAPNTDDRSQPTMQVGPQPAPFTPPPAAATVEIQETFGDATTATAETTTEQTAVTPKPQAQAPIGQSLREKFAAIDAQEQAAPASYNPDDFEVVEESSAPIVTEPPAAPRFQFDLADDTATAPEVDAEADVFSGVPVSQTNQPQIKLFDGRERSGITQYERQQEWQKWWKKNVDESKTEVVVSGQERAIDSMGNFKGMRDAVTTVHTTKDGQRFTVEESSTGRIFAQPWQPAQQQSSGPQSGIDVSTETDGGSTPPGSMVTTAPVTQDPAIVPSFEQDLAAASEIKDAKGRLAVATEKSVAKMSDEKLMIAFGGASMAFENGGDSPLLRVNVARWHNELVKRGLIQPVPQIAAYAQQPAPMPVQEAADPIIAAAVRESDGKIFSAPLHITAIEQAKADGYTRTQQYPDQDYGFVTKSGRFLTSVEARDHAIKQGQVTAKNLDAVEKDLGIDGTPGLESGALALAQNAAEPAQQPAPMSVQPEPVAEQPAATASSLGERIRAAKAINEKRSIISQAVETGEFASAIVEAAEAGRPIPYVQGALGTLQDTFYAQLPKSVRTDRIKIKPIKAKPPEEAAAPFASTDTSRYVLNTVFFDAENNGVVSTDGRRLIFIPSKVSGKSRMVAARNFQKTEGGYYGGKKATGEKYQKGKPVDGNYPNWKSVVPEERKTDRVYNIDIDNARRAGSVLAGINSSLDRSTQSVSQFSPALITVGEARFNPQFIYDAATALAESGAKQITARIRDEQSPLLLKADNGAIAVIMPVRATGAVTADITTPSEATPDTPAKRSRRRIKNMTAQSGAIDLSIVEDLVEYGKTIYRAGMSFGKWAGEMVKEFGQGIASFLRQAFDRIVQAYKDSPYSDTTGAVGDVRPKQKPRRFEQRVSQAENVSEQTRSMLGDDMYETIGLEPMADEARAWIAENGIEAAERRILALGNENVAVTPLDFTIAQYLQVNLDAMGFHNRAATVARTISRRATSLGQTISVLKLFSRLSPEGIVQYANQVMDEHINTLPPERQAQIRADQQDMVNLEEAIATTRKRTAEDSIINGTQGGEKIQDKLKRRIPDKGRKQGANVSIRSVLTSQATKAEATKQITQLLIENGISASEAAALANAITSRFYTVLESARRSAAQASKPKSGKVKVAFDKLMTRLKNGEVSDQELLAELARMRGLPALTPAVRLRIQNLAKEVRTAPDEDVKVVAATKMFEEVHELVPADFWSKVRTFRIIMMLFSPKTWIKNLGGNNVQWILNIGRDSFVNTVLDPVVSGFSGKRTAARAKTGRLRALLTPLSDLKKGYMWNKQNNPQANFAENSRAALEHLRVLAKLTTQNKFEMADIKDVGRRMFSDPFMGTLESALSIALGGPDRAYWMSAYRASLAQREAAAKANGEWTGRPSPEDIEGAQADAMAAIYQNKNSISDFGIGFRSKLNLFSMKALAKLIPGLKPTDQYGLGSMLLTFAQVPGAIARTAINWSPLGTVNALYEGMNGILWKASNERVGKPFDQAAFNKAFTEALGGSGIYVAGYWLYAMGIITASQEEDDDLEAMRKAMGMGQFSINMSALKRMLLSGNIWEKQQTQYGDAIYKYDWVQPIAITFAAGAELAKMVEENDRNGIKKGLAGKAGMAALSLAAGAKSLEELPLLSGLSSFMKTWGNDSLLAAVTKTVAGEPSAFVPQLVRQANQLMDNTLRQTRGGDSNVLRAFNQLAANTPGVGDKYPPRMDITGTPMERYHRSGNTVFNVLINPAVATYVKTNPVFDEVQRLMSATGETRQLPREVKRAATINGQRVDLSNEQLSAYQYYVGNYTMSTFNWRINNPGYLRLPDTEKVKMLAQDMEDIDAAVKSALFGHDIRRLTRRQRVMRANLVNSPLGQSMPPR